MPGLANLSFGRVMGVVEGGSGEVGFVGVEVKIKVCFAVGCWWSKAGLHLFVVSERKV